MSKSKRTKPVTTTEIIKELQKIYEQAIQQGEKEIANKVLLTLSSLKPKYRTKAIEAWLKRQGVTNIPCRNKSVTIIVRN